jgi:hypothetical protein
MILITYKDKTTENVGLISKNIDKEQCLMELIMYYVYFNMNKVIRINDPNGGDKHIKTVEVEECKLIKE